MRIKNHEYYAEMVQRAVVVGIKIRKEMGDLIPADDNELSNMTVGEANERLRKVRRRGKGLGRIAKIQAQAYKIAYGVDAPTIPEIG